MNALLSNDPADPDRIREAKAILRGETMTLPSKGHLLDCIEERATWVAAVYQLLDVLDDAYFIIDNWYKPNVSYDDRCSFLKTLEANISDTRHLLNMPPRQFNKGPDDE